MYHEITIIGNVGNNPEMRYIPSGESVTTFSVASNREYKNSKGEKVKETIWFRVTAWGKTGEAVNQYTKKGHLVLVVGRLHCAEDGNPRIWSAKDGSPHASNEVTASMVRFLTSKAAAEEMAANQPMSENASEESSAPAATAEDINF
jgi:single-strand DNA-binding protein